MNNIKAFIIAAVTADGFIARGTNEASLSWTSKEDKKHFIELSKRAGVVVMGSTTFQTFPKPLKDRLNIVYTRSKTFDGVETTSLPPQELLAQLEQRGYKEVAICGGSEIYSMFMNAGVIDTIYLTVEPTFFGKGITLFNSKNDKKLQLVSSTTHVTGTQFLEYKVI